MTASSNVLDNLRSHSSQVRSHPGKVFDQVQEKASSGHVKSKFRSLGVPRAYPTMRATDEWTTTTTVALASQRGLSSSQYKSTRGQRTRSVHPWSWSFLLRQKSPRLVRVIQPVPTIPIFLSETWQSQSACRACVSKRVVWCGVVWCGFDQHEEKRRASENGIAPGSTGGGLSGHVEYPGKRVDSAHRLGGT